MNNKTTNMKNFLKTLFIPSGSKAPIEAYQSWTVRWNRISSGAFSRGDFYFDSIPEAEVFASESDAHKFAEQLSEAFKLVRVTGAVTTVTVKANQ